jgi:hypothetical protein
LVSVPDHRFAMSICIHQHIMILSLCRVHCDIESTSHYACRLLIGCIVIVMMLTTSFLWWCLPSSLIVATS